jgi:hypothetical protein
VARVQVLQEQAEREQVLLRELVRVRVRVREQAEPSSPEQAQATSLPA